MNGQRDESPPRPAEIRAAVLGKAVGSLDRRVAIALLLNSSDPEREALLASVVGNADELPPERAAAAIALGHIETATSEALLTSLLRAAPPTVLPDLLRSLGRVGTPATVDAIASYRTSATPAVSAAAEFAEALVAHRYRLPGHDLRVPPETELLAIETADARSLEIDRAADEEAREVRSSLVRDAYGVDLAPGPLARITCGTDVHIVCLNKEFADAAATKSLFELKALLALAALRSREASGYSVSYIVLSLPSKPDVINLLAPRCSGRPALAGSARLHDEAIGFHLRSVNRPGARALEIEGVLESGRLTQIQGRLATTRRPAPRPLRSLRGSS